MFAVIWLWQGIIHELRVTNDLELAHQWREELDREHGIERDGEAPQFCLNEDDEVLVMSVDRLELRLPAAIEDDPWPND